MFTLVMHQSETLCTVDRVLLVFSAGTLEYFNIAGTIARIIPPSTIEALHNVCFIKLEKNNLQLRCK